MISLQAKIALVLESVSDHHAAAELIADLNAAERDRHAASTNRERQRRFRTRTVTLEPPSSNVSKRYVTLEPSPPFSSPLLPPPIPPPNSPPTFSPPPFSSSPQPVKPRRTGPDAPYDAPFLAFWAAFPRKVGKGLAWQSWLKIQPALPDVLKALTWQVRGPDWTRDNGDYIPHPATYLNQRRWEDEPRTIRALAPAYQPATAERETRTVCFFHEQSPSKPAVAPATFCRICKSWTAHGPWTADGAPTLVTELLAQGKSK